MVPMRLFAVFILLYISYTNHPLKLSAQNHQSLSKNLEAEQDLKKARSLVRSDRELAVQYYERALEKIDDKYQKACIQDTLGLFNWQLGNFDAALLHFNKSLQYFEKEQDPVWLGRLYNNIAVVYWGQGYSNEALEYYQKALTIRTNLKDITGITNILNNIGLIYQNWKLYDEALNWHNQALEKSKSINNYNTMAYSYSNIGICFEEKNELDTALLLHQTAFNVLHKENKLHRSTAYFLVNIGDVFEKKSQLDSALYYYKSSLYHAERIKNKNRIAVSQHHLGKAFLKLNLLDSAQFFLTPSLNTSSKQHYNVLKKDNLFALAELEYKKGLTQKAYQHLKHASALRDSIFNQRTVKTFNDLQVKYNIEQKEKENILLKNDLKIQQLKIQRQRITAIISFSLGGLILLISLFLLKSSRSLKKLSRKLQNSEKELKEINANKDKFFSIISHDLKAPFTAILGTSKLLASDFENLPPDKIKELVHIQQMATQNAYNLLESLLKWARLQMGRINLKKEKIDLFVLSHETLGQLKSNASQKNLHIQNQIPENTFINADRKAVATVLRNLINNAIKFTEDNGVIKIQAFEQKDRLKISVSDTGIGMSPNVIEQLFRIDRENSNKGTNNESGTGLGLIICKELLERQGGTIEAESTDKKGSTFSFTLPRKTIHRR